MKFLLGQKLAMTQMYGDRGEVIPVTAVRLGPCVVTQVKTQAKDGYSSVQVGLGEKKHVSKALQGHFAQSFQGKEGRGFRFVKEFRLDKDAEVAVGTTLDFGSFQVGEKVNVIGTSKGKGFAGVVKRHHFRGHPTSHGHKDQERMPGSIGAGGIQHVFKGQRMAGHMGDEQVTVKNLAIVALDLDAGIIHLKGAVPGARNGLVMVQAEGDMKYMTAAAAPTTEEKAEGSTPAQEASSEAPAAEAETAPVEETPAVAESVSADNEASA